MRRRIPSDGMETHLSLVLLVCASLLISAFALSIGPEQDRGEEGLFELRLLQAGCISTCLLSHEDERDGSGPLVRSHLDGPDLIVLWTGSDHLVFEGGPLDEGSMVLRVLSCAPDGLGCLLTVCPEGSEEEGIGGQVAVHRTQLEGGINLTVFLPLHRGSATYKGVTF